jgi:hypothetical protein
MLSVGYAQRDLSRPYTRLLGHWIDRVGAHHYYQPVEIESREGSYFFITSNHDTLESSYELEFEKLSQDIVGVTVDFGTRSLINICGIPPDGSFMLCLHVIDENTQYPDSLTFIDCIINPYTNEKLSDFEQPSFIELTAKVEVVDWTNRPSPSDNYQYIEGIVKNVGTRTAEYVRVIVKALDRNDNLVALEPGHYVDPPTLKPGQEGTFQVMMEQYPNVETYTVRVTWDE